MIEHCHTMLDFCRQSVPMLLFWIYFFKKVTFSFGKECVSQLLSESKVSEKNVELGMFWLSF